MDCIYCNIFQISWVQYSKYGRRGTISKSVTLPTPFPTSKIPKSYFRWHSDHIIFYGRFQVIIKSSNNHFTVSGVFESAKLVLNLQIGNQSINLV